MRSTQKRPPENPTPSLSARFVEAARDLCAVPGLLIYGAYVYVTDKILPEKESTSDRRKQEHINFVTSPEEVQAQMERDLAFEENRRKIERSSKEIQKILKEVSSVEGNPASPRSILRSGISPRKKDLH